MDVLAACPAKGQHVIVPAHNQSTTEKSKLAK
jgi:hypothetical protein